MTKFPNFKQLDAMDCGPTCIKIVSKFYGKNVSIDKLKALSNVSREGVSLLDISHTAENLGFRTLAAKITSVEFLKKCPTPFIVHWKKHHFLVIYKVRKDSIHISDPAGGLYTLSLSDFYNGWILNKGQSDQFGIALFLEPTPEFFTIKDDVEKAHKKLGYWLKYLRPYKGLITQLFIGMVAGSLIQLIFPFLTQSIVDVGIINSNIDFIKAILIGQIMLFLGRTGIEFLRGWILLHLVTRVNIAVLSDFLIKLLKLPLSYFDRKKIGDLVQRIGDHKRIESFLTSSALNSIFSLVNILIFGMVLLYYDVTIFLIFIVGSILYLLWAIIFLKKRRSLDFRLFDESAKNQNTIIQLLSGIQEIKLNNNEREKRWEWERIQVDLFKLKIKSLSLSQYQSAGSFFINELKNIIITYVSARSVIDGDITLGMMLSVQYIIGQLNNPINQLISILHKFQDAKISLERLSEINDHENEEKEDLAIELLPNDFFTDNEINFKGVTFKYPGYKNNVLSNISFEIPNGKKTAIVGSSGSGKTTILKLILKFYESESGEITVNRKKLKNISHNKWRANCGAVMQNGFIFNDSILKNITINEEYPNYERLRSAIQVANLEDVVEALPLGLDTYIGLDGQGLSEGQKQRILIARVVYKNPNLILFDEATNSLDANNEKIINENLDNFFTGKTTVIIAHRLSTVKNADQIIVLDKGEIIESGTHDSLLSMNGQYYELVKNQLDVK